MQSDQIHHNRSASVCKSYYVILHSVSVFIISKFMDHLIISEITILISIQDKHITSDVIVNLNLIEFELQCMVNALHLHPLMNLI